MSRLEHALALARQGLFIFPLRPGSKEPFSKEDMSGLGWPEYMTTDEATIRGWFADSPTINYGVSPGKNAFILDPDESEAKNKHGLQTLADLEAEHFEDPIRGETFEVQSPRGGRHLYLFAPITAANSASKFGQDIDVRGFNGYVVGPGSHTDANPDKNTAEGEYVVVCDKPIMQAPEWVIHRLQAVLERSERADDPLFEMDMDHAIERAKGLILQQTDFPTAGHGGDNATYHFITLIRDQSISEDMAYDLLTMPLFDDGDSWNDKCVPPWDVTEFKQKVENAYRYAKKQPGSKGGLIEALEAAGTEFLTDDAVQSEALTGEPVKNGLEELYYPGDKLLDRNVRREMIIPDWLMAHGMTAVLARRSVGKTVVMLDMGLRIACDLDWHGLAVAPGWAVVYACGEDDLGLQENMKAWTRLHEVLPMDDRFIVMAAAPNLMQAEEVATWTRFLLDKLKGRRAILMVDTWQRATSRASQNDDDDMQTAVAHVEAMAKSLHGPAVVAFHPPKANETTMMGSSVPENSTTAIWQLKKEDNFRKMEVTRIKGKGEGSYQQFNFKEVSLGEKDDFGDERTGVVPTSLGGTKEPNNPTMIALQSETRAVLACIVLHLLDDAENNDLDYVQHREKYFNMKDTALRMISFARKEPNSHLIKELRNHAFSIGTNIDTLRRALGRFFIDDSSPQQTREENTYVAVNRKKQFVRMTGDEL